MLNKLASAIAGVASIVSGIVYILHLLRKTPAKMDQELEAEIEAEREEAEMEGKPV